MELLAVRSVPPNLDLSAALFHQLIGDGAIRHAVLLSAEGVSIGIEDQANRHVVRSRLQ